MNLIKGGGIQDHIKTNPNSSRQACMHARTHASITNNISHMVSMINNHMHGWTFSIYSVLICSWKCFFFFFKFVVSVRELGTDLIKENWNPVSEGHVACLDSNHFHLWPEKRCFWQSYNGSRYLLTFTFNVRRYSPDCGARMYISREILL